MKDALWFFAAIAVATIGAFIVAVPLTFLGLGAAYVLAVAWRFIQAGPEGAAMVIGLAALVLDYMRGRKMDEQVSDRVVDLSARVAVIEATLAREEREP